MKLLVLATDYPDINGNVALMYIHTRNKYYVQTGVDVTVINFRTKDNYMLDGVKVITLQEYMREKNKYDILVSHAPNIRNHYKFIKKYESLFNKIVFFFHGHEMLKISEIYPEPYEYMSSSSGLSILMRDIYDLIKLNIWKRYFIKTTPKTSFVFVSSWMYEMFLKHVKIDSKLINEKKNIIYNSIGKEFEVNVYNFKEEKEYDFITIRNNLDGSKYCIDVVTRVALLNPDYKFCIIGKGEFFNHYAKPANLEWKNTTLDHSEIIDFLNKSKCALIPTRTDAQGVMACEMASFGIPLITSNIDVCKEVFSDFSNVGYIDNDAEEINIRPLVERINNTINQKNEKYYAENTIGKEIELFNLILSKKTFMNENK